MAAELPPISVVVIGRNEGERLERCLQSVWEADYPAEKIELIYVDTDSTDDSCTSAERLGAKVIQIKPERPNAAAARNAGLHAVSRELIQFLDGDTILNRSWLKQAVAALDDASVAIVFGRVEELAPTATIYNFWANHDWYVPPGTSESGGGIMFCRASVLRKAGCFDETLIAGEEKDLVYRIRCQQGVTFLSVDKPMVLHDINMTRLRQYWWRCWRSGYAYAEVARKHPGLLSWRRACRRNSGHVLFATSVFTLSLAMDSGWPAAVWAVALFAAILRSALRVHSRIGSLTGAMVYSLHLYISKLPTACGQWSFLVRSVFGCRPARLIEYK